MRRVIIASATSILAMSLSVTVHADVEWAYQVLDESLLPQRDLDIDLQAPRTVPGSSLVRPTWPA